MPGNGENPSFNPEGFTETSEVKEALEEVHALEKKRQEEEKEKKKPWWHWHGNKNPGNKG